MKKGFTLIELIVTVTFFAILLGLVTINLLGSRKQVAQESNVDVLIGDIRAQQSKAMTSEGTSSNNFGVYLQSDKYTLFTGGSYNPNAGTNFVVDLDPSNSITSITIPNSTIVFEKGSGEVVNFISGQNTFHLGTRTMTINKLGVISIQ